MIILLRCCPDASGVQWNILDAVVGNMTMVIPIGQLGQPPGEPAASRRPNSAPKQTSHKRQISEAIPRNECLNSPKIAPCGGAEQGPEHAQEAIQEARAAGTGLRKRARRPKQRNWGAITTRNYSVNGALE